jgi:hypothetical protein
MRAARALAAAGGGGGAVFFGCISRALKVFLIAGGLYSVTQGARELPASRLTWQEDELIRPPDD